jgi:hypothetical protein
MARRLASLAAVAVLAGCTSPHGPKIVGDPLLLSDGSKLSAFDVVGQPDNLGFALSAGQGLLRTAPNGKVSVEAFGVAEGPADAGMLLQAAISAGATLGGSSIIAGATRQGLNTVSQAISGSTIKVDPKIALPFPKP